MTRGRTGMNTAEAMRTGTSSSTSGTGNLIVMSSKATGIDLIGATDTGSRIGQTTQAGMIDLAADRTLTGLGKTAPSSRGKSSS